MTRATRRWMSTLALACTLSTAGALSGSMPAAHASTSPTSPTWQPVYDSDFPDPSVMVSGGTAWAFSTQSGLVEVPWASSGNLVQWQPGGDALANLPPWASYGSLWAPSIEPDDSGQFVMWYTTRDAALQTQCLSWAVSSAAGGPYVDTSTGPAICQSGLGGSIDPDIFVSPDGAAYLYWKNDGNAIGKGTALWVVPLASDLTTITGPATEVLASDQSWQGGIVEGPDMTYADGAYDLFYSGNSYSSYSYAIGYAVCRGPLGPCVDSPANPVLTSGVGMSGPGGPSVFVGPDGALHMAFAAWPTMIGYGNGGIRAMYVADVTVASGGVPQFAPVDPIPMPQGYWEVGSDGGIFTFGGAGFHGSNGDTVLTSPIVGMARTPDDGGYWEVAADGTVSTFGDASYLGSLDPQDLSAPIVSMATDPATGGYWLVASDGAVFAFGSPFDGSMLLEHLNAPIVSIAATPDGGGYWLVASDGGVFSFGDAAFYGSMGGQHLNQPVVSMAADPLGGGYWLVASDGGIFTFGDATFDGSMGAQHLNEPVVAMASTPDGGGYWLVASDGGIFTFGDAVFEGSMGSHPLAAPVVSGASIG